MSSQRARERRINQGVFISGMTGSGKSRMAERLAKPWRRVVFVDPTRSFEDIDFRATTYAEFKSYIESRWKTKPFRVAVTFSEDADYSRMFGALYHAAVATHGQVDDVLIVIDEIDLWSNPHKIDPGVQSLLRYGRHYGLCWIAVCRADVETNRTVRMNATQTILFRQGMLSSEMRRMLESAGRVRGDDVQEIARLEKWSKSGAAVEGTHYVSLPDPFGEWLPSWEHLARSSHRQ